MFAPLGLVNFLPNYGVSIFPPGSIGNIVLVCIVVYAAIRHHLMDIDVFVMRAAATLLASVAVVLPVAGAVIWVQRLPIGVSSSLVIGCLLLAATVSLLMFSRFRSFLEQGLEGSLFPTRRAARDAIRQLSGELVELARHDDLSRRVTATLMTGLGVNGVALYLGTSKPTIFKLASSNGSINAPDVVGSEALGQPTGNAGNSAIADGTDGLQWELCVPVRADGSDVGFIALGPKLSGAAIDDTDVTLLTMVAAQLAIAVKNAEYLHQIQRQKTEIDELRKRVEAENVVLRTEIRSASQFKEIIGSSPALQRVLVLVETVAPTNASIVITGETGTGKELIARAIHELSPRRGGPLINVNCPAIPPGLAESELFGHERGAFTDAVEARPGKFELADGGTIFLDEVAELSLDLQVKLLRVLQDHETQRVGGRKIHKLDIRVVAATNRALDEEVRAGRFRGDLYYRLAAMSVHVPALRERADDIAMLANFFLQRGATTYQKVIKGFSPEAVAALRRYNWPGNIRELQHVIERAVLLCASDIVKPEHLSDVAVRATGKRTRQPMSATVREEKVRLITQALAETGGNQAAAARLLGITRAGLGHLIRSLGLKSSSTLQ